LESAMSLPVAHPYITLDVYQLGYFETTSEQDA
jgi:hypothetical protein